MPLMENYLWCYECRKVSGCEAEEIAEREGKNYGVCLKWFMETPIVDKNFPKF